MATEKQERQERYGRVTVKQDGRYIRIRWSENGRQVERGRSSWDAACDLAREVDARLRAGESGAPEGTFAVVADAAMARSNFPNYNDASYYNLRSLLRIHIIPVLGARKASSVTRRHPVRPGHWSHGSSNSHRT